MGIITLPERVGVLDDVSTMRDEISARVTSFGFEAIPLDATAQTPSGIAESCSGVHYVICDQRLDRSTKVTGAEVVAELSTRRIPAVLLSQYKEEEVPGYRHVLDRVPIFLTRREFDVVDVRDVLTAAERILSVRPLERKPYKALLRVVELLSARRLVVRIPAWHVDDEIELSLESIRPDDRDRVKVGDRLFGSVNLHATDALDVFVRDAYIGDEPETDYVR
jgi:hypothetical protein